MFVCVRQASFSTIDWNIEHICFEVIESSSALLSLYAVWYDFLLLLAVKHELKPPKYIPKNFALFVKWRSHMLRCLIVLSYLFCFRAPKYSAEYKRSLNYTELFRLIKRTRMIYAITEPTFTDFGDKTTKTRKSLEFFLCCFWQRTVYNTLGTRMRFKLKYDFVDPLSDIKKSNLTN